MKHRFRSKRSRALLAIVVGVSCATSAAVAATVGRAADSTTLTVAYWTAFDSPGTNASPNWLKAAMADLQKTNPNVKLALDPITSNSESEYYAKLDLAMRSSKTSPDVVMEDSFLIGSDATAGYIEPLPQLAQWAGWSRFYKPMQKIITYNGKIYGAMNSTDVQLIYYDANLFRKAGLPVPWQPHSWSDILSAAKTLKNKESGVTPAWIYTGQPLGEASSFRGFEVFLDGTKDRLYDYATKKWEISGPGFEATWNFLAGIRPYEESEAEWSNPNASETVNLKDMPAETVGMVFDGNWVPSLYLPGSAKPWSAFPSTYRVAKLPTRSGQAPGYTNQSGGFALSVPTRSKNQSLAVRFVEEASSAKNLAYFDATDGNLPPRKDVSSQSTWQKAIKTLPALNIAKQQLQYTNYRPGLPPYVKISNEIAVLTGEVSSGKMTATQAAQAYATAVSKIVGAGNTERMKN